MSTQVGETNGEERRSPRLENSHISNEEVGLRIRAVGVSFPDSKPLYYTQAFISLKESLLPRKVPEVCTNVHTTCRRGQGPAEVGGTHSTDECSAVGTLRVLLHMLKPCVPTGDTENSKQTP